MAKGLWPVINVENVDKSLEFYKMLGLKTAKESGDGFTWGSVTASPDAGLVIWDRRATGPNQDQADLKAWLSGDLGKGVLFTIGVPNARRVWEKVSNLLPVDQPLREEPWGGASFSVVDPDGYVVNLADKFPEDAKPARKVKRAVKRTVAKAKRVVAKGKAKKAR